MFPLYPREGQTETEAEWYLNPSSRASESIFSAIMQQYQRESMRKNNLNIWGRKCVPSFLQNQRALINSTMAKN